MKLQKLRKRQRQMITDKNAENIEKEAVKSFAIFVENMNRGRTRRILDALEKELYARNFLFQIFITKNDPKLEEAYVTYCKDTGIDAIFIEDCSSVSENTGICRTKKSTCFLHVLFHYQDNEVKRHSRSRKIFPHHFTGLHLIHFHTAAFYMLI